MFCDDKKTGIFIVLFGLCLLNMFSAGSYLLLIVCFGFLFFCRNLKVDQTAIILVLFSAFYLLFELLQKGAAISSGIRTILFPLCYLFGYHVVSRNERIKEEQIVRIIVFVALAFALHGYLNLFMTIAKKGIMGFGSGVYTDFWTRKVTSSTGQAANYYLLFAVSGFVVFGKYDIKLKLLLMACEFLALGHCVLCGVRMCLILSVVVFVTGLFVRLFYQRDQKTFIQTVTFAGVIFVVLILTYELNLFNLRSIYESSYMYYRLHSQYSVGLFQDDRLQRKAVYLQNLFRYPFGGQNIRRGMGVGYAHDLWLDTFDAVGVVPLGLLIIYTVSLFVRLLRYNRRCSWAGLSIICVSMLPSLAIVFFLEPIIDSYPLFFAVVCMIDGMMNKRFCSGDQNKEKSDEGLIRIKLYESPHPDGL